MNKIKTYEQFNEKAIPFEDILKTETQQGLIVKDKHSTNGVVRIIALYDFDDKKILAYAQVRKWSLKDETWQIDMTAAEKNYGPDLYDFALMSVYPESVKPSHTIKIAAQKVWTYYKDNRSDVKKEIIDKDDEDYEDDFEENTDGPMENDPAVLDLINIRYTLKQSDVFTELVNRGKIYMDKYNVKEADILRIGRAYFWKKYG